GSMWVEESSVEKPTGRSVFYRFTNTPGVEYSFSTGGQFACSMLASRASPAFTMQINVIEYFEKGALRKCRDKTAVHDQGRDYSFAEVERFAKNLAALILK